MSGICRALIAGCCLSLSGCLSTMMWSPYGHVVSEWAGEETSFDPPPITDSNKISDPTADNKSAEAPQVASEPAKLESPFDRARAKQQMLEPLSTVPTAQITLVEHKTSAPTPTTVPPSATNPPQLNLPPQGEPILLPVGPSGTGRMNPTVRGGILNLGPNDSGVERAIELAHQLSLLDGENKLLSMRVRQLESDLETREKLIDAANGEVEAASKDVLRARTEIEALRKDLAAARERLRQAARDDLETLQTILSVLRRLTLTAAPMRPSIGE